MPKCSKTHLRTSLVPIFLPGLYSGTPDKEAGDGREKEGVASWLFGDGRRAPDWRYGFELSQ